jgi:hypothetical protein
MLRKTCALICAAAAGVLVSMSAVSPTFAGGGGGTVQCTDPQNPKCHVDARAPGQTGGTGGGEAAGDGTCRNPGGQEILCVRDGGWAGADGCYYRPLDLSTDTVAALGGRRSGGGSWYIRTCYDAGGRTATEVVWRESPPAFSPEVLARHARSMLTLPAVVIRVNPAGDQLVSLPTWLSLDPASWRSQSATASVPGVSVTATATATRAVWSMGTGDSVVCYGPGTPWKPGMDPVAASPDCGYRYSRSSASAPGGAFTVTVTVSWLVTWAGAGQSGRIPGLTTTGSVQVRVAESQAVITG